MKKRTGNIQRRGVSSFRIRYRDNDGIRHQETINGARDHAERELAARLGDIAKGLQVSSKPNTVLFGELADDVLTDYEINGYASLDDQEGRIRLHLLPVFGKRKASQITTAQIKTYILTRQKEEAATGTIKRELELMRRAFNLAIQGRKLLHMPHVPMLREDNVRSGFFTRAEVDRLCSHLKAPLDSFVLFGFLTGWRYSEIRDLEWRNVDFVKGEIRIDVGSDKSRAGRVFPMMEELRGLLAEARTRAQKAVTVRGEASTVKQMHSPNVAATARYVFAFEGQKVGAFRKSWKTACYKAGLPCVVEPVKKRGKPGAVKVISATRTFHDLRRSAARELQAQGYTEGQIMRMCGWSTRSVFDRYNIVTDADIRERMEAIERAAKLR